MRSHTIIASSQTSQPIQTTQDLNNTPTDIHPLSSQYQPPSADLVVTSVGRATIPISILGSRSRLSRSGILSPTEPALLSLVLGAQLDVVGGGMARQGIGTRHLRAALLAAPPLAAAAPGVPVGWGGAETLLALVVAGEEDLEEDGDEEEETVAAELVSLIIHVEGCQVRWNNLHSNYSNCKSNLLQLAGHTETQASLGIIAGIARAQRGMHGPGAGIGAIASQDGDGYHRARKADIEDYTQEGEERDATQAADEDNAQQAIECRSTGETFDSLQPSIDVQVVLGQDGKVIGEDAKDDGRIQELQHSNGEAAEA